MLNPPDAETPEQTAQACGVCRSIIYRAMSPDPAKRKGLPLLPSMKIGMLRRIRIEARRKWLEELEAQTRQAEAALGDAA
jgi:hypothetical protein